MKKIFLFVTFMLVIFASNNVVASSSKIYYNGIIKCAESINLSDIEVSIYISEERSDENNIKIEDTIFLKEIKTNHNGEFYFFGDDYDYLLCLNNDTLPMNYYSLETYFYLNEENSYCEIIIKYSNILENNETVLNDDHQVDMCNLDFVSRSSNFTSSVNYNYAYRFNNRFVIFVQMCL